MIINPFTYSICDGKTLVNNQTIDLGPYRITGLCGPMGSGKSTFIKLLVDYRFKELGIFSSYGFSAYLSQDLTRLFTGNTVQSIINMYRDARFEVGRHFQEKAFDYYLKLFDFPGELRPEDFLTDFSEGERQRLAIALTAATTAKTAVYDEPTTALNQKFRHLFYDMIHQQAAQSRIFIISHRITDILATCDSIIYFKNLQIQGYGSLGDMIKTPEMQEMLRPYIS
ncbi:MAG: ATP-binding cassette, subfamily bacterial [Candidatus Marinimicrobia bacterium]|jgi:ABC-type multidrug transport system ATPase subunit|nr:ATP-binding cassette, subfamily bacterial [Candidatus Neomarinimicrobiota bacterium]